MVRFGQYSSGAQYLSISQVSHKSLEAQSIYMFRKHAIRFKLHKGTPGLQYFIALSPAIKLFGHSSLAMPGWA